MFSCIRFLRQRRTHFYKKMAVVWLVFQINICIYFRSSMIPLLNFPAFDFSTTWCYAVQIDVFRFVKVFIFIYDVIIASAMWQNCCIVQCGAIELHMSKYFLGTVMFKVQNLFSVMSVKKWLNFFLRRENLARTAAYRSIKS